MSSLIEKLEARLAQILRDIDALPGPARLGMQMLADEIVERIAALKAGQPDPYA